jgi:hypothetical protein
MDRPATVRQLLVGELRQQVAAWPQPEALVERRISWSRDRSAVLADLYYHAAEYRPRGAIHGVAQALVGVRADKSLPLGSQEAWAGLTERWSPSDEAQVIAACREFIRAAGRSRIRSVVPQVLTRESFERYGLHPDLFTEFTTRKGIDGPIVTRTESTWYAELWVPEVRLGYTLFAMKYACTFPTESSSRRAPMLGVVDSIPGFAAPVE